MAACIGTWTFSSSALEIVRHKISANCSSLDAVEQAVACFESDPETGIYYVGRGGPPNSEGVLQCDAAVMNGRDLAFGAVAALEGISSPICVARRVMESSRHSVIVGSGAQQFAISQGFSIESSESMMSLQPPLVQDFSQADQGKHDTIGIIALDTFGDIAVGVSTSGMPGKHPGRVGDSPLPGCGLYADNEAGAACATGDGDEIMKYCPSYDVVRLMREQNLSPSDACRCVVNDICGRVRRANKDIFEIGIIAMNMKGECGAAGTVGTFTDVRSKTTTNGFPYCTWHSGEDHVAVLSVEPVI